MGSKSELELSFETYWIQCGGKIDDLEYDYEFHPTRRWRFDYASVKEKVAIELEGGTWTGGRHVRGAGYRGDCEKYNQATLLGWKVFRFTSDMLSDDPWANLKPIIELLGGEN